MLSALLVFASVVFLDVVLSGDNAVVVGMAANTLEPKLRNRAIFYGMALAAVARIAFSLFAIALLQYRLVSILGGFGLLWVAYRLGRDIWGSEDDLTKDRPKSGTDLKSTMYIIALADISMSLDNVLAVSAVARNNPFLLALGLITSIACVGFGAKAISLLLLKYEWLSWVGFGLILIIAVELIFGVKAL